MTQKRGITQTRKKIWVNYFFMRNTHMKFQIPNIHHSKVNTHTHTHTDRQTDKPKAICPSNFFKVGGIKIRVNYFFMRNTHMKFQIPNMHHSEVNGRTHTQTDRQAKSNMPFQLFQSWGHKNGLCPEFCYTFSFEIFQKVVNNPVSSFL